MLPKTGKPTSAYVVKRLCRESTCTLDIIGPLKMEDLKSHAMPLIEKPPLTGLFHVDPNPN